LKHQPHVWLVAVLATLMLITSTVTISSLHGGAVKGETTESAPDLLKFEWPQFMGDASATRFSSGPAPDAPDIMWKTNITGIQSYISAFNGKIFVTTRTAEM